MHNVMNNNSNPFRSKNKVNSFSSIKRQRLLHSEKKLTQSISKPQINSNRQRVMKTQLKAFIQSVPADQSLIQEYIQELKGKLEEVRHSPKRKYTQPLQNQRLIKKRNTESKQRQKSKSVNRLSNQGQKESVSKSVNFNHFKRNIGSHRLLDLNELRDQLKKCKQKSAQKRIVTQKQNNRYALSQQFQNRQMKNIAHEHSNSKRSDVRMRSNTEQVIRSSKNPARMYRYSSQKKNIVQFGQTPKVKIENSFIFDKIIQVNHNINIYPSQQKQLENSISNFDKQNRYSRERLRKQTDFSQPKPLNHEDNEHFNNRSPEDNEKIQNISTINAKKQTLNFLGESCMQIKDQLKPKQQENVEKLLDFLGWKTRQIKHAFSNHKQKKRKIGLDRLSKIFPKGFFA